MKRVWWIGLLALISLITAGCGPQSARSAGQVGYSTSLAHVQSSTAWNVDPGTTMNKPAPNFTLTDQFGQPVSLSQYRGRVVVLAFQDSQCTNICPLTSQEMVKAKQMLGAKAASQVQLVAVNANPVATSVADVRAFSKVHGTMHSMIFATGPQSQLEKVWKAYKIYVAVTKGAIDHTPGVFIIDPQGRERKVYLTQMAYNGMGQQAEVFAQEVARILPHPTKTSKAVLHRALIKESVVHQASDVQLPQIGAPGLVQITGGSPHLLIFTASWLNQLSNMPQQLRALNTYQAYAKAHNLPSPIVVDEAPTEPSASAFPAILRQAGTLHYPTAVDKTGAVAAKLGVQDLTWYALVDSTGKVIWAHDGSDQWLSPASLEKSVAKVWHHV